MIYAPVSIRKDMEDKSQEQYVTGDRQSEPKYEPVNGPEDIFLKNDRPTRYVFMQGEAGRGNTVYCQQLMKYWCESKRDDATKDKLSNWEKGLSVYDFLFLVRLRHVDKSTISLVDMICDDIENRGYSGHRETICQVLSSEKYRCLVLIDGLDEWKVIDEMRSNLTYTCIPNRKNISHSTLFFTMRPWKFEAVSRIINENDRVVEIQGLDSEGIETVMEKLLINHFQIKRNSPEYNSNLSEMKMKAKNEKLKSLLQVPLLAVVSILLWYKKENVGNSMTTFYIAVVRMLIERAFENESVEKTVGKEMEKQKVAGNINIPNVLLQESVLNNFTSLLYTLGEIAYVNLTSTETSLVFEKKEIEKKIGEAEFDFALKVGILTHSESSGPPHAKHVKVNFFHKTVQEFLAAVYISSNDEASQLFLQQLSSIEILMDLEMVNIFIAGLSPSLAVTISHHIVDLASNDVDICLYRQTLDRKMLNKSELLYNLQLDCLIEIIQSNNGIIGTAHAYDFQISDVFVSNNSDADTVHMTADVLRNHSTKIVSLFLSKVHSDKDNGISNVDLNNFLSKTTTLQSLYIYGCINDRQLHTIHSLSSLTVLVLYDITITPVLLLEIQRFLHNNKCLRVLGLLHVNCTEDRQFNGMDLQTSASSFCDVLQNITSCKDLSRLYLSYMFSIEERDILVKILPQLSHLKVIEYYGCICYSDYDSDYDDCDRDYDHSIVCMVSKWAQLHKLVLGNISLGDRSLELTPDMDQMKDIVLIFVEMTNKGWSKFITSLVNIQHQFDIELYYTNISTDCIELIHRSPHFTITNRGRRLFFTRKFPPKPS